MRSASIVLRTRREVVTGCMYSSASVPLALRDAHDQGRLRAGDRVLMTAFGSGLTWAGGLLRFF